MLLASEGLAMIELMKKPLTLKVSAIDKIKILAYYIIKMDCEESWFDRGILWTLAKTAYCNGISGTLSLYAWR